MYVYLGGGSLAPELREADNFREFKIVIDGHADRDAVEALAEIARIDGDAHAWLNQEAVTQLPGAEWDDPAWRQSYTEMVSYASSKGWVDDAGAIRAHIERVGG